MNRDLARRLWLLGALLALLWLGGWFWTLHQGASSLASPTPTPSSPWVYLYLDGQALGPIRTGARTPGQLLDRLGLSFPNPPQIWLNDRPWNLERPFPPMSTLVLRVNTRPPTPTAGPLPVGWVPPETWPSSSASPLSPTLAPGMWQGSEEPRVLYAAAGFVGEALVQHGLAPQGLDVLNVDEDAPWPSEEPIQRVHIFEEIVLEQETIPFEAKYEPLPEEPIDTLKVVHPGTVGIKAKEVLVRYENGEEVARVPLGEGVLQPPRPRIIGYGTKITIQTLQTPDGPIQYWRAVQVYATSYSPCRVYGPGGPCDDITASGERLRKGIIAVRLSWYRYMKGMRVYVPGYGFGIIADVGGGLGDRLWIDLGFSEDDYESWHRWTTLYFLAPPPPPDRILWILPP